MEAIESQRTQQLEQTKTPEVVLHRFRLVEKGGRQASVTLPRSRPEMKDGCIVRQIEIVAVLESGKPSGLEQKARVRGHISALFVQVNRYVRDQLAQRASHRDQRQIRPQRP